MERVLNLYQIKAIVLKSGGHRSQVGERLSVITDWQNSSETFRLCSNWVSRGNLRISSWETYFDEVMKETNFTNKIKYIRSFSVSRRLWRFFTNRRYGSARKEHSKTRTNISQNKKLTTRGDLALSNWLVNI